MSDTKAEQDNRVRCLATLQNSLEEKLRNIQKLDENILNMCATEEIESENEETETVNSHITEAIESCK